MGQMFPHKGAVIWGASEKRLQFWKQRMVRRQRRVGGVMEACGSDKQDRWGKEQREGNQVTRKTRQDF